LWHCDGGTRGAVADGTWSVISIQALGRITVPLDVYGLPMGTYTFSVNGVRRGMFTLQRNNRFAEDCWLTQGCPFQ
jgi:hypothetical protein